MTSGKQANADLARILTDRNMREMVKILTDDGWEFLRLSSKNHPILVWPKAQDIAKATGIHVPDRITLSLTPSDHRAILNSLADARRVSGVDHRKHFRENRGKH